MEAFYKKEYKMHGSFSHYTNLTLLLLNANNLHFQNNQTCTETSPISKEPRTHLQRLSKGMSTFSTCECSTLLCTVKPEFSRPWSQKNSPKSVPRAWGACFIYTSTFTGASAVLDTNVLSKNIKYFPCNLFLAFYRHINSSFYIPMFWSILVIDNTFSEWINRI